MPNSTSIPFPAPIGLPQFKDLNELKDFVADPLRGREPGKFPLKDQVRHADHDEIKLFFFYFEGFVTEGEESFPTWRLTAIKYNRATGTLGEHAW